MDTEKLFSIAKWGSMSGSAHKVYYKSALPFDLQNAYYCVHYTIAKMNS